MSSERRFVGTGELHWLSSPKMTVLVMTRCGVVTDASPVVRKFVGQPLGNLLAWMKQHGKLLHERIDP